jgi:hypothetical protein
MAPATRPLTYFVAFAFSFLPVDLSLGVCLFPAVFCGCKGWSPRP